MSKVRVKSYGINFVTNKCDRLNTRLTNIQAKIGSVNLPFNTSILSDATSNLDRAKSTVEQYKSSIINASQYAVNADSEFQSAVNSVDKWDV